MSAILNSAEEAQLLQTIEMFEAITQSQPHDVQSLEILKEAYSKLGREKELIATSKRIAEAYVQMGQISSAILEYEGILQRFPEDPDTLAALGDLESRAVSLGHEELGGLAEPQAAPAVETAAPSASAPWMPADFDDGRTAMHKIFVEGKIVSQAEFDACWVTPDLSVPPTKVHEPFVQVAAEKGYVSLDKALRVISDKTRLGFLPLERYDIDVELARSFPKETLFRWCVLPFDRMSKSVLVATTNPFNKQASLELEAHTKLRLLWYLAPPADIAKLLRKIIR